MECKVSGTEGEGFIPNFFIPYQFEHIAAHRSQNADKKVLVHFMMTASIDSHVYMKSKEF